MSNDKPPPPIVVQSPGVVSVATGAVDALRGTPILLVMVLLNCAFIGAGAYYLRTQQDNVTRLVDKVLDRCLANQASRDDDYVARRRPARPYSPTPSHAIPKEPT